MSIIAELQSRMRTVMAAKGVSMADLAARTGRRHSDVRRSLREPHWWRLDRLLEYAEALEIGAGALMPPRWHDNSTLTGTPDRIRSGSPESRIMAAAAAGAMVLRLNRIGSSCRKKRK